MIIWASASHNLFARVIQRSQETDHHKKQNNHENVWNITRNYQNVTQKQVSKSIGKWHQQNGLMQGKPSTRQTRKYLWSTVSEVAQLCPTLCDPTDCSLPGFSLPPWDFPGKSTIAFSRGSSRSRDRTLVSCIPGRCFNLWATREHSKVKSNKIR